MTKGYSDRERTGAPLLQTTHLTFQIGDRALLHDISLSLKGGEIVGLIGPNGAGKSTLLRLLSGLWRPSNGEVLLNGKPIADYSVRNIARLVGQVQQSAVLDAP